VHEVLERDVHEVLERDVHEELEWDAHCAVSKFREFVKSQRTALGLLEL